MGVMMLAAEFGAELTVRASGPDAEEAVAAIADLIANKFGEKK
jgi:phosphocarrier protein